MTTLVVMLMTVLIACAAPQTESAGAQRSEPAPTLTPLPVQASTDEAPVQSVTPTDTPTQDTASPDATVAPLNTEAPNALPNDTRIVINAPAYRMDIFENGKLIKTYQIGIGYPEFPLPVGMRTANAIIFNPTWTPPDEPWVESPNSKVKVGQKVAAGSSLNPLGLVKIPIGSPSLIHGGKATARLGGFASHGCVGLTNAQAIDFSRRLAALGGVELTAQQIAKFQKNRSQTQNISLKYPVPVELRYETIVVQDGKLHIYRDVYERGTNTEENLRNALGAYGLTLENLSESERLQVMTALDQMGRNAGGKPVPAATPSQLINAATGTTAGAMPKNGRKVVPTSRQVTRRVKGEKEVVVVIASLAGKGYSAPVELDSGKADTRSAPKSRATATIQTHR
ncbi:MAG TPA: L,D-transpeptidase [Blastocatellia bacterium]|nr:L,D-transpeptidase [Blastocatellia bacterium]